MADPEDQSPEAFRAEVARAFGAISGAMEVVQANLFATRALVDLLEERQLLRLAEVRERALALALGAELAPRAINALTQLLDENGFSASKVLQ